MPVLSPHRSSSSGLSGSYRPLITSLASDRSLGLGSSYSGYTPRVSHHSFNSYTPRVSHQSYRTSSYTDSDGRRLFSRSGSITEDGVTSRFWEESREGSVSRRDSSSYRDSSSSYRDGSIDTSPRRDRESSLSRTDPMSTLNVIDSVAEMRNKYSPANYVPAILRNKNENISRSKSINDIGLPPIEKSNTSKKKVTNEIAVSTSNNPSNGVSDIFANTTNKTHATDYYNNTDTLIEDNNGNRASVADLCKKFDDKSTLKLTKSANGAATAPPKPPALDKTTTTTTNKPKPAMTNGVKKPTAPGSGAVARPPAPKGGKFDNPPNDRCATDKNDKRHQANVSVFQSKFEVNGSENDGAEERQEDTDNGVTQSRVNQYASYIPYHESKEDGGERATNNVSCGSEESMENGKDNNSSVGKLIVPNDVGVSTKLSSRTPISPSSSRRSNDREITYRRRPLVDGADLDGLRSGNAAPRTLGLNGLKNIGNTCFMNSVIQCLSNTRLLSEYLRQDVYVKDINMSTSQMKGALIKAFAEVIKELWSEDSSDRVVNTVSLKSQIQRFAPRFMGYAQQDAQEFLRYLLEGLHEDVNRVTERPKPIVTEIDDKLSDGEKSTESWSRYLRMDNSKIVDIFVGQLKSTLRCTHCGHCSVTFDPFWDLSLPIPQRTGPLRLQQCLDSFTREETLDGDEKPTCSKCKERRKCTKSFSIQKFPKILVIHLKRFSPTERYRGKLNVTIDFPLEGLDVSGYAAGGVAPSKYALYAVSNHSGTTYSGHYTASCRHPYNNSWHEYNDSRVSSVNAKSVVSSEAYVLFYEQEGAKSHL